MCTHVDALNKPLKICSNIFKSIYFSEVTQSRTKNLQKFLQAGGGQFKAPS